MGGKNNRETENLEDEFHGVFPSYVNYFLYCQFTTLAKDSRHTWSLFGAKGPMLVLAEMQANDFSPF